MLRNAFKILISVRAKLFFGFCSMAILITLLGGYAFLSISSAGSVVKDTFDRPLMAINFARSASQVFGKLEHEVQEQRRNSYLGHDVSVAEYNDLITLFREDLSVARERSIAPKAVSFFNDVELQLTQWTSLTSNPSNFGSEAYMSEASDLSAEIIDTLDIIVELQTNQSFRNRETAIANMNKIKTYSLWATLAASGLTLLFSTWIALTIINPLKAAAMAARKISAGNLGSVDI